MNDSIRRLCETTKGNAIRAAYLFLDLHGNSCIRFEIRVSKCPFEA